MWLPNPTSQVFWILGVYAGFDYPFCTQIYIYGQRWFVISGSEIISWVSSLFILFCVPLISACTLYLFLLSPESLLFSPAASLAFSIILMPKICQKFCCMSLCHFRFPNSPLEFKDWSNSKQDWGEEKTQFSSPHCVSKKQNDLLPHSDGKI